MTQALAEKERYLSDFQTFQQRREPSSPKWVNDVRHQAWARFVELGFPTARRGNEKWKYTSVVPIANETFRYPTGQASDEPKLDLIEQIAPWDEDWINLVFVNGRYRPALSKAPTSANGAGVSNLSEAISSDGDLAQRHLSNVATFEDDAFVALNTAFLSDGAFIHGPKGTSLQSTVHLLFLTTDEEDHAVSHPRSLIVAEHHSEMTVIESYVSLSPGKRFTNAVTEIVVGDGANIQHYRLLADNADSFYVGTTRVHQGQDSTFSSTSFAIGAALARNDLLVTLDAPGSSCFLNGLYMTSGSQHVDNFINIDHAKPHATSRLYYKGILDGKSRAVFGGTVLVREGAQKADSQQTDKNLILSDDAEVDSKPSLLIYADDVKCGHGATAGHMDDEAIHYMRTRGLDLETARDLLIQGFASEIVETVRVEPLRIYLDSLFSTSLSNNRFRGTS